MKSILFKIGTALCSFAFFIAINSIGTMCVASAYQPQVPKSLDKYRKDK